MFSKYAVDNDPSDQFNDIPDILINTEVEEQCDFASETGTGINPDLIDIDFSLSAVP
jgi:hypothetical protein